MLNVMKKVMLAAVCTVGVAFTAYAELETSIDGNIYAAFGQYSDSTEVSARDGDGVATTSAAESASFISPYETKLGVTVKKGALEAKGWFLNRSTGNKVDERWASSTAPYGQAKGYINYMAGEKVSFRMGTITPPESVMLTLGQDLGSYALSFALKNLHGSGTFVEQPGVMARYHIHPRLSAGIALYSTHVFWSEIVHGDGYRTAIEAGTNAQLAQISTNTCGSTGDVCSNAHHGTSGSGMTAGLSGFVHKQVMIRAMVGSSVGDSHDGGPTDPASVMGLSGLYLLSKSIQIIGMYESGEVSFLTGIDPYAGTVIDGTANDPGKIDGKVKFADMGLQVRMKLGPGKLTLGYGSVDMDIEAYGNTIEAASSVNVNNDLIYNYALAEGTTLKAIYSSLTVTPDDGDAVTRSFIGAALKTVF